MKLRTALLAATFLLACACAATTSGESATTTTAAPATAAAETPGARLHRLFRESDEANLRRNPVTAMFRGDFRYADRLGDLLTDEYYAAERAAAEEDLAVLARLDRNALSETDQLA